MDILLTLIHGCPREEGEAAHDVEVARVVAHFAEELVVAQTTTERPIGLLSG